jgi:hypothetical protein
MNNTMNTEHTADSAMFTHVAESEWETKPLAECVRMLQQGTATELDYTYDDNLRSFQCAAPCPLCD